MKLIEELTPITAAFGGFIRLGAAAFIGLMISWDVVVAEPATPDSGTLSGQIVDEQTGEPLIGATIMIENTLKGTATDLDGKYSIASLQPGAYDVLVRSIGYSKVTVKSVQIDGGRVTRINLSLKPEALQAEDIVVVARAIKNTEAGLLKDRQRSDAISDVISAEGLSKAGIGNAAEALVRVTGASVEGGKYVLVRGLGERYSNAFINGVELPSADPDKNSFQMDLLPSAMLDRIVVVKSFTADRPGDFSGGAIDIGTKTFPESFTMNFSTSTAYDSRASLNRNFLTYHGGGYDWLGFDDGTRDIPSGLENASIPDISYAFNNSQNALLLDQYSKSFNSTMAPVSRVAPLNQNYLLSIGNKTRLMQKQFGYLASFNYGRKYSYYDNGQVSRWRLSGNVGEASALTKEFALSDAQGKDAVSLGGLLMSSYKLNANNEIGTDIVFTRSAESSARYLAGQFLDGNLPADATYETRVLKYTERALGSMQLRGRHAFAKSSSELEWTGGYAINIQDEPDLRFFSDHFTVDGNDTTYTIRQSLYTVPQRYFRNLDEDNLTFDFKLSTPLKALQGTPGRVRLGGHFSSKSRTFRERLFEYHSQNPNLYDGDPGEFFSDQNMGIIDSADGNYTFGNYIVESSELRSNYDGDEIVAAAFGLLDQPLTNRIRSIAGLRFETTRLDVSTQDPLYQPGRLRNNDFLPSLGIVYRLNPEMNVRLAYGRTLARPTFRELAPFPSWDFANGFYLMGNPDLKRTIIDNFDLRWEWFGSRGEVAAVSAFGKLFENPIERAIKNDNGEIQYQNVDRARVYGLEFELRRGLGMIADFLADFMVGSNISIIRSEVDIPTSELLIIRTYDPDTDGSRPLQGQSPYIVNLDLGYDNSRTGTVATLTYNLTGSRLSEVSLGGTPDIYELPRPELDFLFNQRLLGNFGLKFSAGNLLDSSARKAHEFRGRQYISLAYSRGRTFLMGISYNLQSAAGQKDN